MQFTPSQHHAVKSSRQAHHPLQSLHNILSTATTTRHLRSIDCKNTVREALRLYQQLGDADHPSFCALNILLKILIRCKQCDQVRAIWSDIDIVDHHHVSWPLMWQCLTTMNEIGDDAVHQMRRVLQRMQQTTECMHGIVTLAANSKLNHTQFSRLWQQSLQLQKSAFTNTHTTAMMNVLVEHAKYRAALLVFDGQVHNNGRQNDDANAVMTVLALKACVALDDAFGFEKGRRIHTTIIDIKHSAIMQDALLAFYTHYGAVDAAFSIFESMGICATTSASVVTALMKLLIRHQRYERVLCVYDAHSAGRSAAMYRYALLACIHGNARDKGSRIHADIEITDSHSDISVHTALLKFYGHFGDVSQCQRIFDRVPISQRSVQCIATMMNALMFNGHFDGALHIYQHHHQRNQLDALCHMFALKACLHMNDVASAKNIISHSLGNMHKTNANNSDKL